MRPQGPFEPLVAGRPPIDPEIRIGHVHLRTADIDRIRAFDVDLMGFDVVFEARDVPGWGTTGDILFVSAGGYHRHLALDHGTHEAVYLQDPDGNTLELAWDRPFEQWIPYGDPAAPAIDAQLDLEDLLAAAG
jgi:catechol 2,3-dioxygenase